MSSEETALKVLITSAPEDTEYFMGQTDEEGIELVHLPLEQYAPVQPDVNIIKKNLEAAKNIIYGSKRNARYFMALVEEYDMLESVQDRVNLAADQQTADYLEEHKIPAIYPGSDVPIKMLEFLMRLRRLGPVLYPCGTHIKEEIPGLLTELDIEVHELVLFELEGPESDDLEEYQKWVMEDHFDAVIYHSRRSVNRIQAAFPNIADTGAILIAGDQAVADKLSGQDIETDRTAEGSWDSILDELREFL